MKVRKRKTSKISYTANTKIGVVEKKNDIDLGVRSDMKLGTFLKMKGYPSLAKLLGNAI